MDIKRKILYYFYEVIRMNDSIDTIRQAGILPVVKLNDKSKAVPLAKALLEGGIPVIEITCRTECAADAIRIIRNAFPEMLIGAGTVLTAEQVKAAYYAGADFIVSPGYGEKTAAECKRQDIPYIPGAITPTEIERVLDSGIDTIKFFPAEAAGGLGMIKALCAPYRNVTFIPTGGIGLNNLKEYISFPKVIACGGSFMVAEPLLDANDFEQIKILSQRAAEIIRDARKDTRI